MTQAAIDRAVKPAAATCVANLLAMDLETTTQIANMRQSVNDIVASLAKSSGGGGKELQKLAATKRVISNKERIQLGDAFPTYVLHNVVGIYWFLPWQFHSFTLFGTNNIFFPSSSSISLHQPSIDTNITNRSLSQANKHALHRSRRTV